MKVMLRLRDLTTGDPGVSEHADVEAAMAWLRERPRMTEVLGVVFEGLSREDNDRMRGAMRPLDDEERACMQALDEREAAAKERAQAERRREAERDEQAAVEAAKTADPNRPMEVRFRYDTPELGNTDPRDTRPIPPALEEAVRAWVAERNEWVEGRGQMVGEAKVTGYPNDVPKGKERIVHGSFVPVTAHAKS